MESLILETKNPADFMGSNQKFRKLIEQQNFEREKGKMGKQQSDTWLNTF